MLLPARSVLGNCLLALVLVLYHCKFINLMDLQISLGTLSPSAANSLSNNSSLSGCVRDHDHEHVSNPPPPSSRSKCRYFFFFFQQFLQKTPKKEITSKPLK
jgi:hypothetical protein